MNILYENENLPKDIKKHYKRCIYASNHLKKSKIVTEVNISIMRTFVKIKNQSVPYFDIIKRLESLESNNQENKKLLHNVVTIISSMQDIQDEARNNTKKIGFIDD